LTVHVADGNLLHLNVNTNSIQNHKDVYNTMRMRCYWPIGRLLHLILYKMMSFIFKHPSTNRDHSPKRKQFGSGW